MKVGYKKLGNRQVRVIFLNNDKTPMLFSTPDGTLKEFTVEMPIEGMFDYVKNLRKIYEIKGYTLKLK